MKHPERLFDLLTRQLAETPLPDMLCAREGGSWRPWSTAEVKRTVDRMTAGLMESGIGWGAGSADRRDKIALLSRNRPEWVITDLAVQQAGAVLVPVYPNIHPGELSFILQHAQVSMIFVSDADDYNKVASLVSSLPWPVPVYTYDRVEGALHWTELLSAEAPGLDQKIGAAADRISGEDLATIIYTSGTTGTPKGVMLSHRNILSNVLSCYPLFGEIGIEGDRSLSFLPLNHAFERTATYAYIYTGVSIWYAESVAMLASDIKEVRPVVFTTVPRLLEKIYEGILAKGMELKGMKRKLFFWALGLAEKFGISKTAPAAYRLQLQLADRLVFSKWRNALGGRLMAVVTGAASCPVRLLRIFAAARIVIMEGYGMTEASPVITGNRYLEKGRRFGTVGRPLEGVEVRMAPDGEILCRGPNVMMGYFGRPDLTAETLKDGWLHTGDIGQIDADGFLKLTDRKKEIFKTSGGKYIAPGPIENKLAESPFIEQVVVVGAERKYPSALIVPSFSALKTWYEQQGRPYPGPASAAADEATRDLIHDELALLNRHFSKTEQVKKFELLSREWTVEGGELTPTLKPRRKVILEKYRAQVEALYENGSQRH